MVIVKLAFPGGSAVENPPANTGDADFIPKQEYCSGLPFPSLGDLPNPGIEPGSPALQADALSSEPPGNQRPYKSISLLNIDAVTILNEI